MLAPAARRAVQARGYATASANPVTQGAKRDPELYVGGFVYDGWMEGAGKDMEEGRLRGYGRQLEQERSADANNRS